MDSIHPPSFLGMWEFDYNDKPRLAILVAVRDTGGFNCVTPDGVRTFLSPKMMNIRDVTITTTLGVSE